ncbi:dihydrodipicolinate synthase family protein [Rhodovarius crocodyli]|uniref:Dihydrodipicolinate synthase family protein n=1 Tax=Rhodovarius crocodyli TaxID=1979269 RepID=A0A437MEV4_9PROT|nr:dihydrodipicolinate synthase family protein [Rhodovarius crocodyli]RVT96184.1 dihydrodipicolinate synthase family protein [Rhodovarius crocodyli]
MLLDTSAKGTFIIAPTPFEPNGALDLASTARMTERYLGMGVRGMTILGIMGEAPKLEQAEAVAFVRQVLDVVAGAVPVVVGVSAPGFAAMRALTAEVTALGAAGVMIAPPPFLKGEDAVVSYFQQASEAVSPAPWVLQDFPQANGVYMGTGTITRVLADERCVMVKAEDWPGLDKISTLKAGMKSGTTRAVPILGGNSGLFLPEELNRGADGVMTGYAFPELLVDLTDNGPTEAAWDRFEAHLPLIRTDNQQGLGLAVRKHVLARRGIIAHPTARAPAPKLSDAARAEVDYLLSRIARRDPIAADLA